ncbi:hypothetical protein EV193_11683 [Herbihabitans rhizosphaerae]|uniref:Uncharacterized protein n=1 Tax=Herbihabitans rhizosphaerae TaxID=1872711 RepID=A0A4V2ERE4_9PSEU|nr:hypothetical protein [Herbihabitans rhizosphaerae]RZS30562.1 hypothetical protein EV193_11683 [Herbihabitans rhizosphaerae]
MDGRDPEVRDEMTSHTSKTDAELAQLDLPSLVREGLAEADAESPVRKELFGEGAVAGAVLLDRVDTQPRSVSFLAPIARSGGARYVADLPEPLPTPAQTEIIRPWLTAAADTVSGSDGDEQLARWLEAVAAILAVRIGTRDGTTSNQPHS